MAVEELTSLELISPPVGKEWESFGPRSRGRENTLFTPKWSEK